MDLLTFKWGTAPPLPTAENRQIRAFGSARAQVIDSNLFAASFPNEEEGLPLLRRLLVDGLAICLSGSHDDLPALSRAVIAQVAGSFRKIGLELLEIEVQSLEEAEKTSAREMRDPLQNPIPAPPFAPLPLGMFGFTPPHNDVVVPLSLAGAAIYLNMEQDTLLRLVQEGKIPANQVDSQYYLQPSDLDAWKDKQ